MMDMKKDEERKKITTMEREIHKRKSHKPEVEKTERKP